MKYTNQKCQVCNAKLLEGDDIVICPECGAPYHKECYKSSGHCVYEDKHADGFEFKFEQQGGDSADAKICTRCGSENPSDATVCKICGYPTLQDKKDNRKYYKKVDPFFAPDEGDFSVKDVKFPGASGNTIRIVGPYQDPMGGVPKNSTIDGEASADVATVVGQNTVYYMPKFKKMSDEKKKASWNWVAFLVPHFWFFFRKCYLQGAAALMTNIALKLVTTFAGNRVIELIGASTDQQLNINDLMNLLNSAVQDPELASKLTFLSIISIVSTLIMIGVNVIWGIYGNYIYKQRVIDTVRDKNQSAKEENLSNNERIMLLGKSGGTNLMLALIILLFTPEIVAVLYQLIL